MKYQIEIYRPKTKTWVQMSRQLIKETKEEAEATIKRFIQWDANAGIKDTQYKVVEV
jgi:MinD superfamily P-loop ATPase